MCHLEGDVTGRGGVCRKRIVVDSSEYVYVVMMRYSGGRRVCPFGQELR